jgi:hypothetical protein
VILPSKNRKQKKFLFESQAVNKAQAFIAPTDYGEKYQRNYGIKIKDTNHSLWFGIRF